MITAGTYLAVQKNDAVPNDSEVDSDNISQTQSAQPKDSMGRSETSMSDTLDAINQNTIDGKVKALLIASTKVSGLAIDVERKARGHIELSGYVLKADEKSYAQAIALKVDGVDKVTNNLKVDQSVGVDDAYQPYPIPTSPNEL